MKCEVSVLMLLWIVQTEPQSLVLVGVARSMGGQIRKVTLSALGEYAKLEKITDSVGASSNERSDPAVGLTSWNSVEQLLYYTSAEDGFASSYVTPYDTIARTSRLQRAVLSSSDTTFTLSSIQFNRLDGKLYGMVTYSSGEHFFVSLVVDSSAQGQAAQAQIAFQHILQVSVDMVAPALSALDGIRQVYYIIVVRENAGFLTAISLPNGSSKAGILWEKALDSNLLTSLQIDDNFGNLYGMLHNESGHFLAQFDAKDGDMYGDYVSISTGGFRYEHKQDPSALHYRSSPTEIALSISAYSPAQSSEADSSYHTFVLRSIQSVGSVLRHDEVLIESLSLGNFAGVLRNASSTGQSRLVASDNESMTVNGMQASYTKIPSLDRLRRSTAHIQGGLLITVYGSPFVDTAEQMRCRFRALDELNRFNGLVFQASPVSFSSIENAILCTTPVVPSRARTLLDISLNGGSQYTLNQLDFTFFDITLRVPFVGSSKGGTLMQLEGIFLRDLATESVQYVDNFGSIRYASGVLPGTACEFLPESGAPGVFQRGPPSGPQFSSYNCRQERNGLLVDEVCIISCLSPPIPHTKCLGEIRDHCTRFLVGSSSCPTKLEIGQVFCVQLIPKYSLIEFAINFDGQRVVLPGGFAYQGGDAPIVTGARMMTDLSGLYVEFDDNTDLAGTNFQAAARSIVVDTGVQFGLGSTANWILGNRLQIYFGPGARLTTESFVQVRPFTIALQMDRYQFVDGSFALESVPLDQMLRPFVQILSPEDANGCTGLSVDVALTPGGGGRQLSFSWGLRVRKCVDQKCNNQAFAEDISSIFLLSAQNQMFSSETMDSFSAGSVLINDEAGLHYLSASVLSWVIQGRNVLFRPHVPNRKEASCSAPGFAAGECNVCFRHDAFSCPGTSHIAVRMTLLHLIPVPNVQIESGHFFVQPDASASFGARITLPNPDSAGDACFLSVDLPTPSTPGNEGASQVSMRWSMFELAMEVTVFNASVGFSMQSAAARVLPRMLNALDLSSAGAHIEGPTVKIPPNIMRPQHYYFVTFSVTENFLGVTRSSTSSFIFRVRRKALNPALRIVNSATGSSIQANDNMLVSFSGSNKDEWTVVVTSQLDSQVPSDSKITFSWSCIAVVPSLVCTRQWPIDRRCPTSYEYWSEDTMFTRVGTSSTTTCSFATPGINWDSSLNFTSSDLVDGYTYRVTVDVSEQSPRSDVSVQKFRVSTGFTVLREDGIIRLETGLAVPTFLHVNAENLKKLVPNKELVVFGGVKKSDFASGFQGTNGECLGAGIGCEYRWSELGYSIVSDEAYNSLRSQTVFAFVGEMLLTSFTLPPSFVGSGKRFIFELSLWENRIPFMRRGFQQLVLEVNQQPRNGLFSVTPSAGKAFETEFSLRSVRWEDDPEDLPLLFGFTFVPKEAQADPVMVDVFKLVPSASVVFPLPSLFAKENSCNATWGLGCSSLQLTSSIKDIWGAVSTESAHVLITLEDGVLERSKFEKLYSRMRRRGTLENDFGGLLHDLRLLGTLIKEPAVKSSIEEASRSNDSPTMVFYESALLDSLLSFVLYKSGVLVPPTPDAVQMLTMTMMKSLESISKPSQEQLLRIFSVLQQVAASSVNMSPSIDTIRSILRSGASLVAVRLSALKLPGFDSTLSQNARRLDDSSQNAIVADLRTRVESLLESVCVASIGTTFANGPRELIDTAAWSISIHTISGQPSAFNFTLFSGESARCGSVSTTFLDVDSSSNIQACHIVYKYNPVFFTSQRSLDGDNGGDVHQQDGVPWPLDSSACPLSVMLFGTQDRQRILLPRSKVVVDFKIGKFGAKRRMSAVPSKNPLVFLDHNYQAECEYWSDSIMSWRRLGSKTIVAVNGLGDYCQYQGISPPATAATGEISCLFDMSVMDSFQDGKSHVIFAPVTELVDCEGTVDTLSRTSQQFADYGQFAWVEAQQSLRKVCDRCQVCGGLNKCSLFCDSSLDSGKVLDLCGVCGGHCLAPVCAVEDCDPLYIRFLGESFLANSDIASDGLTSGKLYTDGPCTLGKPPGSPRGICKDYPSSARLERYPYHDNLKECWELSERIPQNSPDAACQFQSGSIVLDALNGNRVFSVSVAALDSDQQLASNDRIAKRGGTQQNSSNPLSGLRGTSAEVLAALDQLIYFPAKGFNSGYPPKNFRVLRFQVEGQPLSLNIRVQLKPVNDPPAIFSQMVYDVQEDRASTFNPSIRLIDDADDVNGSSMEMVVEVLGGGGVRFRSQEAFSKLISARGSLSELSGIVKNLQYISGENMQGLDAIRLALSDRGFGGLPPYNDMYSTSLIVNISVVEQNDAPVAYATRNVLLFQNEESNIVGYHITDIDLQIYDNASVWKSTLYEGTLFADQGETSIPVLRTLCNVSYPLPLKIPVQMAKNAEKLMPSIDTAKASSTFLKLDGRSNSEKMVYLSIDSTGGLQSVLTYPGLRVSISVWKIDCFDASAFPSNTAEVIKETDPAGNCLFSGEIIAHSVPCLVSDAAIFNWDVRQMSQRGPELGRAFVSLARSEWVSIPLSTQAVTQSLALKTSALCVALEAQPSVNGTLRIQGMAKSSTILHPNEVDLQPRVELFRGLPYAHVSSLTNCSLSMSKGTSVSDRNSRFEASGESVNMLVYSVGLKVTTKWSNILSASGAYVGFSIWDSVSYFKCLRDVVEFGEEACEARLLDQTSLQVMPLKKERIGFWLQPFYYDRWLADRSIKGELPLYVALEDCGNRDGLDCPSKMQVLPDPVPGEYMFGRFTVELSSRLGTLTVPTVIRRKLDFSKGDGLRDDVVRFSGFTVDVRDALMNMVYATNLDDSLQFKNQFSSFYKSSNNPCSRPCFLQDLGKRVFNGEDEATGCQQSCSRQIYRRANDFLLDPATDEAGVFLDDIVITFTDNGVTGVGLKRFTSVLLYNVYTLAVNDKPCMVFEGKSSSGCRERCSNMGQPANCYDSGLPYDIVSSVNVTMIEGQTEAILLGGLVTKVVDEYESVNRNCLYELADALAKRSDTTADPVWVSECPRFDSRITARFGEVALNSREFIEIFVGEGQRFAASLAFLGFPQDTNAAVRMLRYRIADGNLNFNSNLGAESITLAVTDQGFSGADPSGEFDGSTEGSVISIQVFVAPINSPPEIRVPRAQDPLQPTENAGIQLVQLASSPGLAVADRDSDECQGRIEMKVKASFGTLNFISIAQPGMEALAPTVVNRVDFYSDASCQDGDCLSTKNVDECNKINKCVFNFRANRCECKLTKPGQRCKSLKTRGTQRDVAATLRALLYQPWANTNYLSHPSPPEGEVLEIQASDRRDPENTLDDYVYCGDVNQFTGAWQIARAYIQTIPVNQPCISSFDPIISNAGFEHPVICQGLFDCFQSDSKCGGIEPITTVLGYGWNASGSAGLSYDGWTGDVTAFEGFQHLFLAPKSVDEPSSVHQLISNFVVGASYIISIRVGARTTANFGAGFQLKLSDHRPEKWSEWGTKLPVIVLDEVKPSAGQGFILQETAPFIASSISLTIKMISYIVPEMEPQNDRLVFVDDVRATCLQYNTLEDRGILLSSLKIFDPDDTIRVNELLGVQGLLFLVRVRLQAHRGVFKLLVDDCSIMPPSRLLTTAEREEWGMHCSAFYNDWSLSEWANTSVFRPDCPPGWSGSGTTKYPCVNFKLSSLTATWTPYNSALLPAGQAQIPMNYIEMEGSMDAVNKIVRTLIEYLPDANFNTANRGKENLLVHTNDLGFYNGAPIQRDRSLPIFVEAVNDGPNITLTNSFVSMLESTEMQIVGLQLQDQDIDEVVCSLEPCMSGSGTLQLKTAVSNGTVSLSELAMALDFDQLLMDVFGPVSSSLRVQECLMRMSCNPNGGIPSLARSTIERMCGNLKSPRCHEILQYCTLADLAFSSQDVGECTQVFEEENIDVSSTSALRELDVKIMHKFKVLTDDGGLVSLTRQNFVIVVGKLSLVQNIIESGMIVYKPMPYQNGFKSVVFTVSDQGNVGIGFPCSAPPDVPELLMFQYCKEIQPVSVLDETKQLAVFIEPVNDLPRFELYDENGVTKMNSLSLQALQNLTRRLNRMVIFDPDIAETSGCNLKVDLSTRSGGILFFNSSLAPFLKYTPNPSLTSVSGEGSVVDINIFLGNVNYRSGAQFMGLEDVIVDISDQGCTGIKTYPEIVTVSISISVQRQKSCRFDTCDTCTQQTKEACGWCPGSCRGAGKCSPSQFQGGPPLLISCPQSCFSGICLGWNMCRPPPDTSWKIGAVGGPLLLVTLLSLYTLTMWARRVHGTVPTYLARILRSASAASTKIPFMPIGGDNVVQLVLLFVCITIFIFVTLIDVGNFQLMESRYSIGDATDFSLRTDACAVKFLSKQGTSFQSAVQIRTDISTNETFDGVTVETDFCADSQLLQVNNTRDSISRYVGYRCVIDVEIPAYADYTIPSLHISNLGSKLTSLAKSKDSDAVDFGANSFSISGTTIEMQLANVKARRFHVPFLDSGHIIMNNITFLSLEVRTASADVVVTVSNEPAMMFPFSVLYQQARNNVCFMSKDDSKSDRLYKTVDRCITMCSNESGYSPTLIQTCEPLCQQSSNARLLPFRRDLQPGMHDTVVDLFSENGQLFFSAIAYGRIPPISGRGLLDDVYVYDGLGGRQLGVPESALSLLQSSFFPSKSRRPVEDFYSVLLQGAGEPRGNFVWVSDARYLVISRFALSLLTLGLLVPSEGYSELLLRPALCPPFDSASEGGSISKAPVTSIGRRQSGTTYRSRSGIETPVRREQHDDKMMVHVRSDAADDLEVKIGNSDYLRKYYELLFSILRGSSFPAGSLLAFQPLGDFPFLVFERDEETNLLGTHQVDITDYPLTFALLLVGTAVPAMASIFVTMSCLRNSLTAMKAFRVARLQQDIAARTLLDMRRDEEKNFESRYKEREKNELLMQNIVAGTNFFYFLDKMTGSPDDQQPVQTQILRTLVHVMCIVLVESPLLVFSLILRRAHNQYICPNVSDSASCQTKRPSLFFIPEAVHWLFWCVSVGELYCYYGNLGFSYGKQLLRRAFYLAIFIMLVFSVTYLLVVSTWIFLGNLIRPSQFLPYVVGFFGISTVTVRKYKYLTRERLRFHVAVESRCDDFVQRASKSLPPTVVRLVLTREEDSSLSRDELTSAAVINVLLRVATIQSVMICILLVSFHALTNVHDIYWGIFNALLTLINVILLERGLNRKQSDSARLHKLHLSVGGVLSLSNSKLTFLKNQIEIGGNLGSHSVHKVQVLQHPPRKLRQSMRTRHISDGEVQAEKEGHIRASVEEYRKANSLETKNSLGGDDACICVLKFECDMAFRDLGVSRDILSKCVLLTRERIFVCFL